MSMKQFGVYNKRSNNFHSLSELIPASKKTTAHKWWRCHDYKGRSPSTKFTYFVYLEVTLNSSHSTDTWLLQSNEIWRNPTLWKTKS